MGGIWEFMVGFSCVLCAGAYGREEGLTGEFTTLRRNPLPVRVVEEEQTLFIYRCILEDAEFTVDVILEENTVLLLGPMYNHLEWRWHEEVIRPILKDLSEVLGDMEVEKVPEAIEFPGSPPMPEECLPIFGWFPEDHVVGHCIALGVEYRQLVVLYPEAVNAFLLGAERISASPYESEVEIERL